eukprot:CAMPEP_0119324006 /NCGR_PEP_ID=MMETSP1333-20130426/62130_1 /TAXON_ID=418940 /ORGANISM="Scyphosphaera apsteinii, Strain RCC1455" /LENGTH=218 /DNA_ID=CAMNT_0007331597 /DNA_START=9 /DNA_END=665 /DNA_ORIENTATION=+
MDVGARMQAACSGRILCLHGSGGRGATLLQRLAPLCAAAPDWNFDALDAPSGLGKWWSYAPGQRSFTALSYVGAEESIALVESHLVAGGYCGVLGFSQGAMLAAIIAARSALGEGPPLRLAICMSAALPKPYEDLLLRLCNAPEMARQSVRTLHCLSKADDVNPPQLGEQVASCFMPSSKVLWHNSGHQVPPTECLGDVGTFLHQSARASLVGDGESD